MRYLEAQDADLAVKVSAADARLKGLEGDLHHTRNDVDNLRSKNGQNNRDQDALIDEKNALQSHCEVLTN